MLFVQAILLIEARSKPHPLWIWPNHDPITHPHLNNRERWLDYLRSNPLGKLYQIYREAKDVGLDFSEFRVAN